MSTTVSGTVNVPQSVLLGTGVSQAMALVPEQHTGGSWASGVDQWDR